MRLFDIAERQPAPVPPPIRVNGTEISRAEIAREAQHHPAGSAAEARDAAARALVVRQLLLGEARRLGLVATPAALEGGGRETQEDALVRALLEKEVRVPSPRVEECRRFYKANRARFTGPDLFEASHILFAADSETSIESAAAAAAAVIDELSAHPERFAALAAAHSDCPSARQGGNLGQFTADQMAPEFAAALKPLAAGEIVREPVKTRFGIHVIRLDRRIAGERLPFEAVRERIADYLADAVFRRAVHQYVAVLAGRARIEGIELTRADGPLVQ